MGYLDKLQPVSSPTTKKDVKPTSGYLSKLQPVSQETAEPADEKQGFVKSLVSAPLTMLGRPVQLAAELAGASPETVDKYTKKLTRGFVAPVPKSGADVKKDVGRAVQTVALGASGPVSAGAALGFGASLEQGNDVFSKETAMQTAGGAVAGKVLSKVAPYAGKVVEKVTPTPVKTVFGRATKAVSDFAASKEILPKATSEAITRGANMAETIANKPFEVGGKIVKGAFSSSPEKIINKRINTLQRLEDNNTRVGKYIKKQSEKGFDVKKDIAETDLLQGSVDNTGTIRTTDKGGALEQYQEFIRPKEGVVSEVLKREGRTVPLKDVEKKLIQAVDKSGVKGASRAEALAKVSREIEGYKLELDRTGKKMIDQIDVPVSFVHDAKVDKYANVNYMNENGRVDKAIAKALKQIVENNTASADVAALNRELSRHYANMGFLERLNGTKVEGGRLGKHFARTIGAIAGSHFGPLGAIAGSELAGAVKGGAMSSTFGRKVGGELTDSALMKKVLAEQRFTKLPVKSLPSEYTNELPTIPFGSAPKPKVDTLPVAEGAPKVFTPAQSNNFGKRNVIQPKVTSKTSSSISTSISDQSPKVNAEVFYRGEGGTNVAQGKSLLADGRHFAMDKEYPKSFGKVKEYVAKPDAKIFDASGLDFPEIRKKLGLPDGKYLSPSEYTKALKSKGYDILKYDGTYKSTGKPFVHIVEISENSLIPKKSNFGQSPKVNNKITLKSGFDSDTFFQKQQFKYKTHDNYMENKYVGFADASGLSSAGLNDDAIKWYDNWLRAKPTTPSPEIVKQFSQYKPNKPTDIYWGGSKSDFSLTRKTPQSFTSDINVAKEFGSAGRRDNPIIVRLSQVDPSDIVMATNNVPKELNKALGLSFDESEVVVNNAMEKLSKKYKVTISSDGGKTWKSPTNFGK